MFVTFKSSMMREFDMYDPEKMRFFLGIEVLQRIDGIFINQRKYELEILKRFEMDQRKPVHIPIVHSYKLSKDEDGITIDNTLYKQVVGA